MKILIVTKNWLGDLLFQFPAIEAIKARYPDAEIVCLSPLRCREMLLAHPAVSRVIIFDEKREHRALWRRFGIVFRLRREKWDQGYLCHTSRTRALILALAGVKERIGTGRDRRFFLTRVIEEPPRSLHHADYFLALLRNAGFQVPPTACYRFCFTGHDRVNALRLLEEINGKEQRLARGFVCFHVGANWEHKRWPAAHFARLADLIGVKWGIPVLLTGAAADEPLAEEVMGHVRMARVFSLSGKTNLGELGAIYSNASFVVSGDSGPMHIASGVGAPVVALFGPTNPELTGPRGPGKKIVLSYVPPGYTTPWYGHDLPTTGWLSHIQPEEVIKAVENADWMSRPAPAAGRAAPVHDFRETRASGSKVSGGRNILVVTLSNIGDVILNTPVITALAAVYPDARMTVVTSPKCRELLSRSPAVHRIVVYDKHAGLIEKWKFLRALRESAYALVVDLKNTAIPFLVSARRRSPVFRRYKRHSARGRHLEILEKMGIEIPPHAPFAFFGPGDEKSVQEKLKARGLDGRRGWMVVAPCAASELKTWRIEGFQKVLEHLTRERSEPVLVVGSDREREKAEALARVCPEKIHNLAGQTSLPELAVLISRCSLLLANDSSVTQLGFELDRNVVAVFGPTDPEKFGRRGPRFRIVRELVDCAPCGKPVCSEDRQWCLEDLKAEKVLQACQELLSQKDVAIHFDR